MDRIVRYVGQVFSSVEDIPPQWLKQVYDENFANFDEVQPVVQPKFFETDKDEQQQHFELLTQMIKNVANDPDSRDLWKKLEDENVPGKKLAMLIWYCIEFALAKNSSKSDIQCAIRACQSYCYLSIIQGAAICGVFNPYLLQRCLDLYKIVYRYYAYDRQAVAPTKGKGKKKKADVTLADNDHDKIDFDRSELRELLDIALNSLFVICSKVGLSRYPATARETVIFVRDLAAKEFSRDCRYLAVKTITEFDALPRLNDKTFALMHKLSQDRHSTGGKLVLSYFVFPRLSFWNDEMSVVPSGSSMNAIFIYWKDAIIGFLRERLRENNVNELKCLMQVLENLYARCVDRQDYRVRVSGTIIEVLQLLPVKFQYAFIQRLHVFSHLTKNSVRCFTAEVVPQILKNIDIQQLEDFHANGEADEDMENTVARTRHDTEEEKDNAEEEQEENDEDDDDEEERQQKKDDGKGKKRSREKQKKDTRIERVQPLQMLIRCLVRFCLDRAPAVRTRSLIQISQLIHDRATRQAISDCAQELLESDRWMFVGQQKASGKNNEDEQDNIYDELDPLDMTDIQIDNPVLYLFWLALKDSKANVRKAGLLAIQSMMPYIEVDAQFADSLTLIKKRCVDASLQVRKQAADSLNHALMQMQNTPFRDELENAWLSAVLPMVNDREQGVQQSACKMISEAIISPLSGDTPNATWSLIHKIEKQDNHKRLILRALVNNKESINSAKLVDQLCRKLASFPEHVDVIWMMMEQVSVVWKISPPQVLNTWYTLEEGDKNNKVRYVSRVLSFAVKNKKIGLDDKRKLQDDLQQKIRLFRIAAQHISSVYLCLAMSMDAVGEDAEGGKNLINYGRNVLSYCKKGLERAVDKQNFFSDMTFSGGETFEDREHRLIRLITTVGEVIQFSPSLIKECKTLIDAFKIIMAVQEMEHIPGYREIINSALPSRVPSAMPSPMKSRPNTALGDHSRPSSTVPSSQGTEMLSQPVSSQGILRNHSHLANIALFTPVVRAYCVLVLGKFCLMDEALAKTCVPVLMKQLEINEDHIIRSNIVIVMCDLCIRYTLLVDNYSPIVASCLRDRSTLVRYQTLESLTNLIKEQYIRWGGQIMYRFVATILDENKMIREYAEFCLKDVLLLQFPSMFFNHFLECVFYFNGVERKFMGGVTEGVAVAKKFTLSGPDNTARRMQLYKFMLTTFDDNKKIMTLSYMCEQVLRPIMLGSLKLKEQKVYYMLEDCFNIIMCKEMKLEMAVGKGGDDDDEEPPEAVLVEAKKVIVEIFRKTISEMVLPVILQVRLYLRERKSPLLQLCLGALRALVIDHKERIEEMVSDDQLMCEIKMEIKRYEERERAERREKAEAAKRAAAERRKTRQSLAAIKNLAIEAGIGSAPISLVSGSTTSVINRSRRIEQSYPQSEVEVKLEPVAVSDPLDVTTQQNATITNASKGQEHREPENAETEVATAMEVDENVPEEPLKDATLRRSSRRTSRQKTPLNEVKEEPVSIIEDFIKPKVPKKRTRAGSIAPSSAADESIVFGVASSTPNKARAPPPDLDLSIIRGEANRRMSGGGSRGKSGLEPIHED